MLDRFKLTHRVFAALGLFWLVFGTIAIVGFTGMRHARDSMETIHDVRMRAADALATMTRAYQENRIQILMAFQHDPQSPLAKYHDHPIDLHFANLAKVREENNQASKIVEDRVVDDEEQAVIGDMLRKRLAWQQKRDLVLEEVRHGNFSPDVMAVFLAAVKVEGVAFEKSLSELRNVQADRADRETQGAQQRYDQSKWIFTLALVFGALPVTIMLNLVLLRLSTGFRAVGATATAIAQNDLTQSISPSGNDEIADLMRQMQVMQQNLRSLLGTVMTGAETIASASHQVAAGSLDLSSRTERQAASLEETASATEQLQSTVTMNAENAHKADEMSREAYDVAAKGGEMVGQVVHTMNEIHASSKKIVDIIGVIDSIAFQTNILALNAAVEAARAGDQGRGFAVVASEVRQLAKRSAEAAHEIKDLIGDSVRKVESGTVQVGETGSTMQEIVKSVERVTQIMREIASSSHEQAQGISQISDALSTMDGVTQENAALVEQSSAASGALSKQSDMLKLAVCSFKL